MTTADTIRAFYERLAQKTEAWQRDLAEDVVFADASNQLRADGRDAFIQSFTGFLQAVERVEVRQLIADGNDAAAVVSYDYVSPSGGDSIRTMLKSGRSSMGRVRRLPSTSIAPNSAPSWGVNGAENLAWTRHHSHAITSPVQ
jgi:hypothetical protein